MKSTTIGSRDVESRIPRRRWDDSGVNVGETERIVSAIAGVALLAIGLRRSRLRRLLWPIGASLIGRGITGRSTVNYVLGRNTVGRRTSPVASLGAGSGTRIERSVVVARPAEELYHFWRDFTNLPRFMDNLEAVQVLDEDRSHWVAKGPAGMRVEWDAAIHNEIEGELIAWRSLPGADVDQAGSVHFVPAGDGLTEVRVVLRYRPRGGKVSDTVARLLGDDPDKQVRDDLRRFKQVVEAI